MKSEPYLKLFFTLLAITGCCIEIDESFGEWIVWSSCSWDGGVTEDGSLVEDFIIKTPAMPGEFKDYDSALKAWLEHAKKSKIDWGWCHGSI